jgi:catechol 2,3-dioxygenase-like lactoylglutathione lyase family enzyme
MSVTETTTSTAPAKEPMFEVAQLAHVELFTPKPNETVHFFKELLGLQETERAGQSVYLRAYEDFYHHTLKVTQAAKPGLGHVAWRATSPQALERRVAALESSGLGVGWSEGDRGHGPAYRFTTPAGHPMELYGDSGYMIFDPAWKTVTWREENMKQGTVLYGGGLPAEFFSYGTPPLEGSV